MRKLKAYKEAFPNFVYEYPILTPKDSLVELDKG
jgi:hypothetical protein